MDEPTISLFETPTASQSRVIMTMTPPVAPRPAPAPKLHPPLPEPALDNLPLVISPLESVPELQQQLRVQARGAQEDSAGESEEGSEPEVDAYVFEPPLLLNSRKQLAYKSWGWPAEGVGQDATLALVARRADNDPWAPNAIAGIVPVALRQMRLRGAWAWVGLIGHPSIDIFDLPEAARPAVIRRCIEAAVSQLQIRTDPVGKHLRWLLHRPRHPSNPDKLATVHQLIAARNNRPLPDGTAEVGWEALPLRALEMRFRVPVSCTTNHA